MSAVKKRRRPANDTRPLSSHRMSYVVLPRPYWNAKRVAALCVLSAFAAIFVLSIIVNGPAMPVAPIQPLLITEQPHSSSAVAQQPEVQPQPFDIKLDASALAPSETIGELADMLPVSVVDAPPAHALPSPELADIADTNDETAAGQAVFARRLADGGALSQALRAQHRAAEMDPENMLYRLQLAILYDRTGHPESAAALYRQVIQAYNDNDETLPRAIRIDEIHRRADYLIAMGQQ